MFQKLFGKKRRKLATRFFVYKNRFNEVKPYEVEVILSAKKSMEVFDVREGKDKTFIKLNILTEAKTFEKASKLAKIEQAKYSIRTPNRIGTNMGNIHGKPELCFTGFKKPDKAELFELAEQNGFFVRKTVSANLTALVCGKNAGPSKIKQAKEIGATLIDGKKAFLEFLETGEL